MLALSDPALPEAEAAALQAEALAHLAGPFALFAADGRLVSANRGFTALLAADDPALGPGASLHGVLAAIGRHGAAANPYGYLDTPEDPASWLPPAEAEHRSRDWRVEDGRWFRIHLRRMPRGWVLSAVEVTDFKRQEQDLAEARQRLQTVLDHMTDGVLMWDENLRIVFANNGAIRVGEFPEGSVHPGSSVIELIRMREQRGDFGPPPDTEAALAERVAARAALLTRPEGASYIRATQSGSWVEVTTIPLAQGGTVLTYRDVTAYKRQEQELSTAREQLQTVLDHMTDGVVMWDKDFIVQFFNKETLRVGEFPPEMAYPGVNVLDIMRLQDQRGEFGPPPKNEAELVARVEGRAALLSRPGGVSYMRRTPSGKWIDVRSIPIAAGGAVLMYRDVTALKQREEELQQARATQQLILDHMTDGVVLLDGALSLKLANRAAARFHDVPPEMAQPGISAVELIRFRAERGDFGPMPTDPAAAEALIEDRLRIARNPGGPPELRRTTTGEWVEISAVATPDSGVLVIYRNVTSLKAREQELQEARDLAREAEAALSATIEHMGQGLLMFSPERKLQVINGRAAELLHLPPDIGHVGVSEAEISAWQLAAGEHEEGSEGWVRASEAVAGTPSQDATYVRQRHDGTMIEVSSRNMPDGRSVRTFTDITLRHRQAEALSAARDAAEAANRAKSAFLAAMSHEIRTPMNGVLGMIEVLERTPPGPAQARCINVMRDSAGQLLRIIDDLLDFSKIEAGRLELEALPFSLRGLVEGAVDTLAVQARGKGLHLFADPPGPGPDMVAGDPVRVRQILFNLVGNAIKFTERGFVRIQAKTEATADGAVAVTLGIEDSGVGMSGDQLSKLFQPFAQADTSTTRRYGGTGLGLSIVRRLAHLMGGEVTVESQPGRGSRFSVTLRLGVAAEAQAVAQSPMPATMAGGPRGDRPRLLVVDDHPVNREVLARQLELLGCVADMAEDGARALVLWRAGRHRLALVDIHMPVMDGLDLARAIRREEAAEPGSPRTAIIAVTANALKGEDERCYAAGMDGFLPKPLALDQLARALGLHLPPDTAADAPAPGLAGLWDPEALRQLFGDDQTRLAKLLGTFRDGVRRDGEAVLAALSAGDLDAAAAAAHRLKGAARMAGARRLAELLAEIEAAARGGEADAARSIATALPALSEMTLAATVSVA